MSDFIIAPIKKQVLSYLSDAWDRGHERESHYIIQQALLLFMMISIALTSFLTVNIDDIFRVLLQQEVGELPLEWIVLFIGLGVTAHASKRFYALLIYLERRTLDELRYQTIGLILNCIINLILIPFLGLLGAAVATLVSYSLILFMIQLRYRLTLETSFWYHLGTFVLMAVSIMLVYHYVFSGTTIWWLIMNVAFSLTTYFGLVLLLKKDLLVNIQQKLREFQKLA